MKKVSLITYGSLINKNELLNNGIKIINYTPVLVHGFKREFSQEPSWRQSTSINRAVLSVKEDETHFINALLVDIYKDDLDVINKREIGYDKIKVQNQNIELKYSLIDDIKNKDIFIYSGKKEKCNNLILPNLNYLNICLSGAKGFGKGFYSDFIKSTFVRDEALEHFISTIYK